MVVRLETQGFGEGWPFLIDDSFGKGRGASSHWSLVISGHTIVGQSLLRLDLKISRCVRKISSDGTLKYVFPSSVLLKALSQNSIDGGPSVVNFLVTVEVQITDHTVHQWVTFI